MDMVCLRNISVDTLHKGDTDDDDNNNNTLLLVMCRHNSRMANQRGSTGKK
jgi:hypothetical protein